jgi:outer membrane murein-binding lipoprotein Lpp
MVDENTVIQYVINGGGLALALWLMSKKIDDLRSDVKELNTTIKDIIMEVLKK